MGVSVGANFLSVVHKDSGGVSIAFPDACKTPAPPVPIPYPNIAMSSDAAKTAKKVKADGQGLCTKDSNFKMSTGDEAGVAQGVASNKIKGKAEFVNWSMDVKAEGKNIPRAFDLMLHNQKNTPPVPLLQGPVVELPGTAKPICYICDEPI
ncbi:MAG: DUF4150 domain-containing protein [Deltaproteobacteria bacterium]|nr:DUF4150 domain-containing protein [Deltaproteobacteria bacterium]